MTAVSGSNLVVSGGTMLVLGVFFPWTSPDATPVNWLNDPYRWVIGFAGLLLVVGGGAIKAADRGDPRAALLSGTRRRRQLIGCWLLWLSVLAIAIVGYLDIESRTTAGLGFGIWLVVAGLVVTPIGLIRSRSRPSAVPEQ